eukprot:CAMPEP_0174848812 /NCGR_PEP_ID=MMETSP1114-20130205/13744_1 /TAXON_ID=312471 /ORGANISM="Neobodo designis, Strain CCAP 1951/1" /LENGTH=197 /DNA_ID=CAMNT_0016083117 /DNA_START=44 /DNA_END=637 /DNA_ORIENTATION=+
MASTASSSSRYGSSGWGDEVVRGVQMIRRSQPLPTAPGMTPGGNAGVSAAPSDLALIHETIDDAVALIERLKDSNEQLREYLRELAAGGGDEDADEDDDDGAMGMASMSRQAAAKPEMADDPEILDAITENEFIIKEKTREVNELRTLLSFARCGREARNVAPKNVEIAEALPAEPEPAAAPPAAEDDGPAPTSMEL